MPATDQERELERRVEELARMGYGVELDRTVQPRHEAEPDGRGAGAPWRIRLRRGAILYPCGYGDAGIEALEDAVNQARAQGAV
jgi:hypothetical protein